MSFVFDGPAAAWDFFNIRKAGRGLEKRFSAMLYLDSLGNKVFSSMFLLFSG